MKRPSAEIRGLIRSTSTGDILYLESCLNLLIKSRQLIGDINTDKAKIITKELSKLIDNLKKELN